MFKQFISTIVLFLTIGLTALAQVSGVSGKVVDENGEPLVGVSVVVKGTSTGTITTADGSYSLPSSVSKNATLVFSSIGYTTVEEPIGGRNIVNVQLATDEMFLDETVVVGYATMKKRDLVGAVDAVGHEVIADRASSNLSRALQGSVAGLNITFNDSKPSHAGSYNVRGTGSIGAGGSSLVLIDGVEGSMSMVNPQDVESVSVLKDASSTAVYGARGAFGVILITTKNAKKGRPTVNYSGSLVVNSRTVVPDDIHDSQEWLDIWLAVYDGYYNGSKARLNHLDNKAPYSQEIYDMIVARKSDPTIPNVLDKELVSGFGYTYLDSFDWLGAFYRDHFYSTEHNLSVSGGNENAVDVDVGQQLTELFQFVDVGFAEYGAVGDGQVAAFFTFFNVGYGLLPDAFAVGHKIVSFGHAVQVNVDEQMAIGRDDAEQFFFGQQRVRAHDDILAALNQFVKKLRKFRIEQGLAAAD